MSLDLTDYLEKRLAGNKKVFHESHPFVTISRQTGCNGNAIAVKLVRELSSPISKWKYVNKEILAESAKKLNLTESRLMHFFNDEKLNHATEIIAALSHRYYKSDQKIKNTITELVKDYANEGRIVIVGRAAVGITLHIKKGIHIRLTAPLEWRIRHLKKRKDFEKIDVAKFISNHDTKKENLIKRFCNLKMDEVPFDLTINCSQFNQNQIVAIIINAMKIKELQK